MHEFNSFITLTFDDDHLPDDYSVHKRTFQLFIKRLRFEVPTKIRYFACGEYGEQTLRPHYHALIFGWGFPDRKLYKTTPHGSLFTSALLDRAWGFGQGLLGDVTYQSARYVAGYVMKKIGGDPAATHYTRTHPKGYVVTVQPEFSLQSRRPGIGATWYDKYKKDCFPSDFLVVDGKHVGIPRYYSLKLTEEELKSIKRKRKLKSASPQNKSNRTKERLAVRETVKRSKISKLKRTL